MLRKIKLTLSYDGTNYSGYQRQSTLVTVQSALEDAIDRIHNRHIVTHAASRTDSGVHANCQVVDFKTDINLDDKMLIRAINTFLPSDIRVIDCETVDDSFHARYSAKGKVYIYYISKRFDPKTHLYSKLVTSELNLQRMQEEANKLVGIHNFKSFTSGTKYEDYNREITAIKVYEKDEQILIQVEGKGFLRYMVRTIVGCLIDVGLGKLDDILEIVKLEDRHHKSKTSEAKGLFLDKIIY